METTGRVLLLVKHSLPEIDPAVPANQWRLSDVGRRRCRALAERMAFYRPGIFVSSVEPKAVETASIVAQLMGKPCEAAEGLHEHDRSNLGWLAGGQFEAAIAAFFAQPQELMLGRETAEQAHKRFADAVDRVLAQHRHENVGIVAHGTVITLFVARRAGIEPLPFWQRLGLPSFVVLARPGLDLVRLIENVEVEDGTQMG